jgi:hypothetical protein
MRRKEVAAWARTLSLSLSLYICIPVKIGATVREPPRSETVPLKWELLARHSSDASISNRSKGRAGRIILKWNENAATL